MGLSIHYRGRLKSPDLIGPLSEELEDIGNSLGWKITRLDEDFGRENSSRLVHAEEGSYWETENETLLRKKMEFLAGKIDALTNILSEANIELDPGASPHELADKIEQLLREKLKEL